jgi:hypothetical protein
VLIKIQVDTSDIKLPEYRRMDFLSLKNLITYTGFRMDINNIGQGNRPIDREKVEAAWVKLGWLRFLFCFDVRTLIIDLV